MNILTAIINAFQTALALLFQFIPRLIGFLIILLIGWIVATALEKAIVFLLRKVGFDRIGDRIGLSRFLSQTGIKTDAAGVLGKIVYWFIFLVFLVPAVDSLGLTSVSAILATILAYIPNVFVAILVLFLGTLAATVVADLVRGATSRSGNGNLFANIARYAIIGFVVLVALEQLQIAPQLLNILFGAVVAALALAGGLAFGLGGQETARKYLNRTENVVNQASTQAQVQQNVNQARTITQPRNDVPRAR